MRDNFGRNQIEEPVQADELVFDVAADAACPAVRITPLSNPAGPFANVPTADQTDTGSATRRFVGAIVKIRSL